MKESRPLRPVDSLRRAVHVAPGRAVPRLRRQAGRRLGEKARGPRRRERSRHATTAHQSRASSKRARLPRTATQKGSACGRRSPARRDGRAPPRTQCDAACAPTARELGLVEARRPVREALEIEIAASSSSEATGRTDSAEPTSTASAATASARRRLAQRGDRQRAGALGEPLAARVGQQVVVAEAGDAARQRLEESRSAPPCW